MSIDIENADSRRCEIAFEQFEAGVPVLYKGILVHLGKDGVCAINSYSDYSNPSNISIDSAKQGIERSKLVAEELFDRYAELMRLVGGKVRQYYFCCDYHTGAFAVAEEKDSKFKWLMKQSTNEN